MCVFFFHEKKLWGLEKEFWDRDRTRSESRQAGYCRLKHCSSCVFIGYLYQLVVQHDFLKSPLKREKMIPREFSASEMQHPSQTISLLCSPHLLFPLICIKGQSPLHWQVNLVADNWAISLLCLSDIDYFLWPSLIPLSQSGSPSGSDSR